MGLHKHVDCRKIVSVSERKQIAKRFGRSFVCLGRGHKTVCCDSKEKCHCGGRHHPALCESNSEKVEMKTEFQKLHELVSRRNQSLGQTAWKVKFQGKNGERMVWT